MSNPEYLKYKKFNPFVKMMHSKVVIHVGDALAYEGELTACYNDDTLELDKKILIPMRSVKVIEKIN